MGVEPASLCLSVCVRLFTLSNMNIPAASGSITTKFYPKHHWGDDSTVPSILSGLETRSLGLNTLGTT